MSGNKTTARWTVLFGQSPDGQIVCRLSLRGVDLTTTIVELSLVPPFYVAEGDEVMSFLKKMQKDLPAFDRLPGQEWRALSGDAVFVALHLGGFLRSYEFALPEPTPA